MAGEESKYKENNTPKVDVLFNKKKQTSTGDKSNVAESEPHIHIREFSLIEQSTIEFLLQKKLDKSLISHRPGPGGTKTAYLEGNVVIDLANRILGFNGWSFQIKHLTIEHKEKSPQGDYYIVSSCIVRIVLKDGTFREDIGFGDIKNKFLGAAIENSKKSAITDGLKRALRLFGNSLGNCLYDKEFLSGNKSAKAADSDSSGLLIKKTDTFPNLINSRVSTNMYGSPDVKAAKAEYTQDVMENDSEYAGSGKKRNLSHLYPGDINTTPDSALKRRSNMAPTTQVKNELKTPSINLNDKIEKAALELSSEKKSTSQVVNTKDVPQDEEEGSDFISDDSLDIEDLDREIEEKKLRKERIAADAKLNAAGLEKLPDNIKEEQLSFKNAAALIPVVKKDKEDIVEELSKLTKVANFNIINNEIKPASNDKPLLLNVDKSMKISSENFEKVGHYRNLKNRKYVASAHGSNQKTPK